MLIFEAHGFGDSMEQIIRRLAWAYFQDHKTEIMAGPGRELANRFIRALTAFKNKTAKEEMELIISEMLGI